MAVDESDLDFHAFWCDLYFHLFDYGRQGFAAVLNPMLACVVTHNPHSALFPGGIRLISPQLNVF